MKNLSLYVRASVYFLLSLILLGGAAHAATSVTLTPDVASPQMLGTVITWTATVQNPVAGHSYDFQFSVYSRRGVQIARDFDANNIFTWAPYQAEGRYVITVVARDTATPGAVPLAPAESVYFVLPWVTGNESAVHATAHPLVALFSGPACPFGSAMRVRFWLPLSPLSATTNTIACSPNVSSNFYVAGMLPNTPYQMHWEETNPLGQIIAVGPDLTFTAGSLPSNIPFPTFKINATPANYMSVYPLILFSLISNNPALKYVPTATDLAGNVVWYLPAPAFLTRSDPGGGILTVQPDSVGEYDLAGNLVASTHVAIMNEQLARNGYPTITAFHHEARRLLPSKNLLVIAGRDVVSTTAQGGTPAAPVDILGDMVLVLDANMQLLWAWDSFAHEDINRMATLNDVCAKGAPGCPPFNASFASANDWLHSNSAQMTADGNIIVSHRAQDAVVKINYNGGLGDGSVLWRLGNDGDFTLLNPPATACANPGAFQWFSHQHDAAFQFEQDATGNGVKILTIFDDGNTRLADCDPAAHSRGMVLFMGENAREVALQTLSDLGAYSFAVGSAQLLYSGNNVTATYDNGALNSPAPHSQISEVTLDGTLFYQLEASVWSYRTYRMRDLYTPTLP